MGSREKTEGADFQLFPVLSQRQKPRSGNGYAKRDDTRVSFSWRFALEHTSIASKPGTIARTKNKQKEDYMTTKEIKNTAIRANLQVLSQMLSEAYMDAEEARAIMEGEKDEEIPEGNERSAAIGTILRMDTKLENAIAIYRAIMAIQ